MSRKPAGGFRIKSILYTNVANTFDYEVFQSYHEIKCPKIFDKTTNISQLIKILSSFPILTCDQNGYYEQKILSACVPRYRFNYFLEGLKQWYYIGLVSQETHRVELTTDVQ